MMIAILANSVEQALSYLKKEGTFKDYNFSRRKGVFQSDREFTIVTEPEHLYGLRLSDYRIVGLPDPRLVELARTRMVV